MLDPDRRGTETAEQTTSHFSNHFKIIAHDIMIALRGNSAIKWNELLGFMRLRGLRIQGGSMNLQKVLAKPSMDPNYIYM